MSDLWQKNQSGAFFSAQTKMIKMRKCYSDTHTHTHPQQGT